MPSTYILSRPQRGEDVCQSLALPGDRHAVMLADGGGGKGAGGRLAAWRAVEIMLDHVEDDPSALSSGLAWWLGDVDNTLYRHKKAGEAAALMLVVSAEEIRGCHAGDVAAWALVDGRCHRLVDLQRPLARLGTRQGVPAALQLSGAVGATLVLSSGLWRGLGDAVEDHVSAALSRLAAGEPPSEILASLLAHASLPDAVDATAAAIV